MDTTFINDLKEGKDTEWWFSEYLKTKFPTANIEFNTSDSITELRKWDIKLATTDGSVSLFEVKHDKKSAETGNFAIEYFGRTSQSGIAATTAKYWVILSSENFYIFKTQSLKELINNNNFRQINISNGTAWCYLVPIEKAKEIVVAIITKPTI